MKCLYLLLFILLSSCTRQLVPSWYNVQDGKPPVAEIEHEDVIVRAENLELTSQLMVFDIEIVNNSHAPLDFDPLEIVGYSAATPFKAADPDNEWKKSLTLPVLRNSAMTLEDVNTMYENKLKANQGLGLFMAVVAVGLIVYDIAEDNSDFNDTEWTEADTRRSVTRDIVTASSLVAMDVIGEANEVADQKTMEDLAYLPDEIMLPAEIPNGQSHRGKVYLKNATIYKYTRLVIPIGEMSFIFDFRTANSAECQSIRGN